VTTEPLRAWSALVDVYQMVLHDVVGALERDAGIDSGVYSALAYLHRSESNGRMPLSTLQQLMHPRYSQPGLSRLVQRMESDGLVERRVDPDDGRAMLIVLTRAGRSRFGRAERVYTAALHDHFSPHITTAESRNVAQLLERVLERSRLA
jgi:DNA-binding MarR family transcriptional regulator